MPNRFKQLKFVAAILLPLLAESPAWAIQYHVILMGGQSNMDGHDPALTAQITNPTWANPQTNVLYNNANYTFPSSYVTATIKTDANGNNTGITNNHLDSLRPGDGTSGGLAFGPEVTMGWKLKADNPNNNYLLIKYAVSGTNLGAQWNATSGGNIYANFRTAVSNALNLLTSSGNTYSIDGMVWLQGEADSGVEAQADAYQQNITNFITDIRTRYGANLPFIMGGIGNSGASGMPYRSTVMAAQSAVAQKKINFDLVSSVDPNKTNPTSSAATHYTADTHSTAAAMSNVYYFDNEDLTYSALHFNTYGQEVIGQRFATILESAVPEPASVCGVVGMCAVVLRRSRRLKSERQQ